MVSHLPSVLASQCTVVVSVTERVGGNSLFVALIDSESVAITSPTVGVNSLGLIIIHAVLSVHYQAALHEKDEDVGSTGIYGPLNFHAKEGSRALVGLSLRGRICQDVFNQLKKIVSSEKFDIVCMMEHCFTESMACVTNSNCRKNIECSYKCIGP